MRDLFLHNPRVKKFLLVFFLAITLFFLICLAYKGFFSRYLQDDYCYGKTFNEKGLVWGTIFSYFNNTEYNGNRYSLTLSAGIAEVILGTRYTVFYSLLSILLWLTSLTWLIGEILKKAGRTHNFAVSLLTASFLLTFTFFLSPDLYQILYWRNSSLTYLAPLIMNTFLFAYALHRVSKGKRSWGHIILLVLLSFLSAGFSEVAVTWQITIWSFLFIFNNVLIKHKEDRSNNNQVIIFVLLGAIIGALLLIVSPSNTNALQTGSDKIATFSTLIFNSSSFGLDFLKYSLAGKWLPCAVLFVIGFVFIQFFEYNKNSAKGVFFRLIGVCLCTYIICVACMMPSVLVRTAYPDPRALSIPHFTLMASIFVAGMLTGTVRIVDRIMEKSKALVNISLVLVVIFLAAYLIRMIPTIMSDIHALRARAIAWDQRQALILEEKSLGQTHIEVPAFDTIDRITELQRNEDHWVNVCAAEYYEVESISAIENLNGVKPYFEN
jgi:hypothetical protein